VPGGFVEWQVGEEDTSSYAFSFAPSEQWELVDCIAVVSETHKAISSLRGHTLAGTSPLQPARVADTPRRLDLCRKAIMEHNFEVFAQIVELDSNLVHAVMITCTPALFYWMPATLTVMEAVQHWRGQGLPVCYTVDAGPNVHVLCPASAVAQLEVNLSALEGVRRVIKAHGGGPARLITD